MKLTVRELLRELLTKCDLDAEVKVLSIFADEMDKNDPGKELDYWKAGYNEHGDFQIDVIDFL